VIATDTGKLITFMNPVAEALTGWKQEEAIGKPLKDVFKVINEKTGKQADDPVAKVLREGVIVGLANHTVLIAKDGTKRPVDDSGAPIRDDKGKIIGVVLVFRDITERKKAQEALQRSELKYRELVQNANSIILRMDSQGNVTFFNEFAQQFFGYTEDEILGKNVVGSIVPKTDSELRNLAAMIRDIGLNPEEYANNENENMRKDGGRIWVAWTNKAIYDKDGNIVEILCVGNDVTERKLLERQLLQALKMESIGTLAGGVAHDFNNLLMGILGNASLMLMNTDPADPNRNRLKSIEKQVENGSKLTSQLLGYARKGKYELKHINLNQLVKDTSELFSRTRKDISIYLELSPDLFVAEADKGQIEQVLWNLYVNAADAMPGGGDFILKTFIIQTTRI